MLADGHHLRDAACVNMAELGGDEQAFRAPAAGARVAVSGGSQFASRLSACEQERLLGGLSMPNLKPAAYMRAITALQTRSAAGKWQAATAGDAPAGSGGGEAPFCCLRYDDNGSHAEWVRFVSDSVLEAWQAPQASAGKRRGAAAEGPPPAGAPTQVRPYLLLPADYKKKQGRPSRALTEAREAAEAAADEYEQQRDGLVSGSPAKRPRLAKPGAATAAGAAAGGQGHLELQSAGSEGAAPNGALARPSSKQQRLHKASPTATHDGRGDLGREAATPLARSSKPAAGQKAQHPGGEQQQQEEEEATDGAAGEDPQQADAPPPVQTAQQPKRPAVTELGLGTFASLAPVPEQPPPQQHKRRPSGGAAADAGSSHRQPQGRPSSNKHHHHQQQQQQQQQQRERPRSLGAEAAQGAASAQAVEQQDTDQGGAGEEEPPLVPPEPAPERPGDVACRRFAALLPGLTLMRDSINSAAAAAISAGGRVCGANAAGTGACCVGLQDRPPQSCCCRRACP